MQGMLEGDAEREGRALVVGSISLSRMSITTSQILRLTCTISKSLAQALLCGSDVQPRSLMNDTTLVFHAKTPGKPHSLLLGARCLWELPAAQLAPKMLCFALSRLTWQGSRADGRGQSRSRLPITLHWWPAAARTPPVIHGPSPWLAAANPPGAGGSEAGGEPCSPSLREWGRRGMPLGCLPSWLGARHVGGIPVPGAGSW